MNRDHLAHILRAAGTITGTAEVLVVGSQSILGSYSDEELPLEATDSIEADLVYKERNAHAMVEVNVHIGEGSPFHAEHGVYAEGVHRDVVALPRGWKRRLRTWHLQSSRPSSPRFLDPHDLAASKLARGVEKDLKFVNALIKSGHLSPETVLKRVRMLDLPRPQHDAAIARAHAFRTRDAVTWPTAAPEQSAGDSGGSERGDVWIESHIRRGKPVTGHWRKQPGRNDR